MFQARIQLAQRGLAADMRVISVQHEKEAQSGFIIVAVVWILGALATLAVIYSLFARQTALEFVDHDEVLQAHALEESGVELAAYELTARADLRPLTGRFTFRQGRAAIDVTYRSENSRIDLNFASPQLIAGLFLGLGVAEEDANTYTTRIAAWRNPLKPNEADTEAELYRAAGKTYGPRHGPFQNASELGLVVGVPPDLVGRVLPYFTVYSGQPEVNILAATPPVLAALPGINPERLQLLLTTRDNIPQDVLKAQLGFTASYITVAASRADRVSVDVRFPSGRHIRSDIVILILDRDTVPYHILSWRDEEVARDAGSEATMR